MKTVSRHMARVIEVTYGDGSCRRFEMSIATVICNDGKICDVEVTPFREECEGVTYHDGILRIAIDPKS